MGTIAIAAVGAKLKYAVETVAGTRPTTGYTELADVISAPEVEKTQNMVECSSITDAEEEFVEGKITFTNNGTITLKHNDAAITAWNAIRTAYATAKADGKRMWFEYAYGTGKSFYIAVVPGILGNAGLDPEAVTMPAPVGIVKVDGWNDASTT